MNHPIAEIFSQGEEVISGHVTDTNAAWLSQRLVQMGFVIGRHTAVGDQLQDLVDLLQEISQRADLCICTGGLGPTIDDLTAEAVALAFATSLQFDPIAQKQIESYFSSRNREMSGANRKQAYLPKNALRLDNTQGTAPGFALQHKRCWFVFVPGVPSEMRHMFDQLIKSELEKRFVLKANKLVAIKSIGIGEADLQQKLDDFILPNNVRLGFLATSEEVQTKLLFPADTNEFEIDDCVNRVAELIGNAVFAIDQSNNNPTDLVSVISQLMNNNMFTLSLLETVTQGLISAKCVAQDWLIDSSYQRIEPFVAQLGMDMHDDFTELAPALAKKLKQKKDADLILVQLFHYEKNDHKKLIQNKEENIVIYNALLTPHGMYQNTLRVVGSIQRKQNQAAIRALDLLRNYLQTDASSTT